MVLRRKHCLLLISALLTAWPMIHFAFFDNLNRFRSREDNLGISVEPTQELGAVVYLAPDDWTKRRLNEMQKPRECYFNKSVDQLVQHWLPNNKHYTVVMLNTRPWKSEEMMHIRNRWQTLQFEFLNVAPYFEVHNDTDVFEDHNLPLHNLAYKRMCAFMFHGITRVPQLFKYQYLLRLDDDLCIESQVPYDIFKEMELHKAHYGFSYVMWDWETVTRGMHDFQSRYVQIHNITRANPLLDAHVDGSQDHRAFATHFEVIDMVRYRMADIANFTSAVMRSDMIFHRRWGDAPLRFIIAQLFWKPEEILNLCDFLIHNWYTSPICPNRTDTLQKPIIF